MVRASVPHAQRASGGPGNHPHRRTLTTLFRLAHTLSSRAIPILSYHCLLCESDAKGAATVPLNLCRLLTSLVKKTEHLTFNLARFSGSVLLTNSLNVHLLATKYISFCLLIASVKNATYLCIKIFYFVLSFNVFSLILDCADS